MCFLQALPRVLSTLLNFALEVLLALASLVEDLLGLGLAPWVVGKVSDLRRVLLMLWTERLRLLSRTCSFLCNCLVGGKSCVCCP